MNKKIVFLIALMLTINSLAFAAPKSKDIEEQKTSSASTSQLDKDTIYYPNANIESAVEKYKNGNYTGCLQELFSLTKQDPSNITAYYYMAMAYTYLDMQDDAIEAYEKVLSLDPNSYLADYATRGRDCLTGGPTCLSNGDGEQSELDKFINSPYGNGLSPEINEQNRQKQLKSIQETINKKENLEIKDIEKIRDFDEKNSDDETSYEEETIKIAQASDEEVLKAINTLRDAGLNLTVQSDNLYASQYQDPKMAEMSMLPMLMSQAQKGENIDPRFMQAMMMSSMMSDFGNTNNNDRY